MSKELTEKYKSLIAPMNDQNDWKLVVDKTYFEELKESRRNLWLKQQQAIAFIKDGRFVEALRVLEK